MKLLEDAGAYEDGNRKCSQPLRLLLLSNVCLLRLFNMVILSSVDHYRRQSATYIFDFLLVTFHLAWLLQMCDADRRAKFKTATTNWKFEASVVLAHKRRTRHQTWHPENTSSLRQYLIGYRNTSTYGETTATLNFERRWR